MDDLEVLLNNIVEAKRGIDAIFVSDLGTGFLLDGSKTLDGREPELVKALMGPSGTGGQAFANTGIFGALQQAMDTFGVNLGHGRLNTTILQFGERKQFKGILVVYVYRLKRMSLAIGFVNTKHDVDALGGIVVQCEANIDDVLEEVEKKYGP